MGRVEDMIVVEMIAKAPTSELLCALQYMRSSFRTPWPGELCPLELAIKVLDDFLSDANARDASAPSPSSVLITVYQALRREIDMRFPPSRVN